MMMSFPEDVNAKMPPTSLRCDGPASGSMTGSVRVLANPLTCDCD